VLSLVVPLFRSEENLPRLLQELLRLRNELTEELEVVFVVDGSPDRCAEVLAGQLPSYPLETQLVTLSRNFGSFCAIAAGLERGRGERFAVLAADLQEPPALIGEFSRILQANEADVCFGIRDSRSDPWLSEVSSRIFWALYSRFVIRDMPPRGVDVFGCNRMVRDRLLGFGEVNTNLIALLLWLGFRRRYVPYARQARQEGRSAWTFRKKLRYSLDSIFSFTDLPIQFLLASGALGAVAAVTLGSFVLWARLTGAITVPGYTPVVLVVMFFGGLTAMGLGIIGQYLWLTLQNTRRRPNYVIHTVQRFGDRPNS
jgi:glycosyltransferase involved in cell wall biosynthesis